MIEGERRLAAIMFTDLVGFTALGQTNEPLALSLLDDQRNLVRPILRTYGGREVKTIGDAFLVDFPSALNAVKCAYEIQKAAREANKTASQEKKIHLRIGVHLGDVVESSGDISGDAVNVASRIESLSKDGGVCLTRQVFDQVQNKFQLPLESIGQKSLKNLRTPVEVFRMVMPWEGAVAGEAVELESRRVAVLPLKNMSPDPGDEYFADGMTEELITALSGVRELTVIARTSVMQYKDSRKRVVDIGKELGTGTIIEGSVRKAVNKVRITVQVVDAKTEGHLWAQNYDRQLDDVFAIQSEIAKKVAGALKVTLVKAERDRLEKKPTENTEAYSLLLKGRFYWNERTKASVERGILYLKKAVESDPKLAVAYSDLASAYTVVADYGMMEPAKAHKKMREYASKALQLDPRLSQPHAALGAVFEKDFQWGDAEREFKLAIELDPNNATAHHWYALDFQFRGMIEESLEELKRAKELDPMSLVIGSVYGYTLVRAGRKDEGLAMQDKVLEMNDSYSVGLRNLSFSYLKAGEREKAVEGAKRMLELGKDPVTLTMAASILGLGGFKEEADVLLKKALQQSKTEYTDPYNIAIVYASIDEEQNALDWFEKAVNEKTSAVRYVNIYPQFDKLRNHPRFKTIMKRMGL